MGIFDELKTAIFGKASGTSQGQGSAAQPAPGATPAARAPNVAQSASASASNSAPSSGASAASSASPASSSAMGTPTGSSQQVDIQAVLQGIAARKAEKLNWQSSIVDLMKLVDLNPSLENRKALAGELGYTGDTQDSASMNVWLHRQVMMKLAASGGKVPDSLRH